MHSASSGFVSDWINSKLHLVVGIQKCIFTWNRHRKKKICAWLLWAHLVCLFKNKDKFLKKSSPLAHIVRSPAHWNSLGEGRDFPEICNAIYLSWIMSTSAIVSSLWDLWNLLGYELAWRLHGFWDLKNQAFDDPSCLLPIDHESHNMWHECVKHLKFGVVVFWGDWLLFWWEGRTLQNISSLVQTFTIQLWIYLSICI